MSQVALDQVLAQLQALTSVVQDLQAQSSEATHTHSGACSAITKAGLPCKARAVKGTTLCVGHTRQAHTLSGVEITPPTQKPKASKAKGDGIDARSASQLAQALKARKSFTWHSASAKVIKAHLRARGKVTYVRHEGRVAQYAFSSPEFGTWELAIEKRRGKDTPVRIATPV